MSKRLRSVTLSRSVVNRKSETILTTAVPVEWPHLYKQTEIQAEDRSALGRQQFSTIFDMTTDTAIALVNASDLKLVESNMHPMGMHQLSSNDG